MPGYREVTRAGTLLAAVVLGVAFASPCAAFTLKSLVMPGRVIAAHASIEDKCESCHESNDKQNQAQLCFSCHTAVRDDVAASSGFHGRDSEVKGKQCYNCHAEHEGRDAKIVKLDPKAFEHSHTDFPLTGAHRDTSCTTCHVAGKAYRETPQLCSGCHSRDDPHAGALGAACGTCHAAAAWKQTTFDHSKTRFPLLGMHGGAACGACHAEQRFAGTPTDCAACHRTDDVHKGRNGAQCAGCHTPSAWPVQRFDHVGKTGFALRGAHERLACQSCHVKNLEAALPKTCVGCHQKTDPHAGRLGTSCGDCHSSSAWRDTGFDHATVAKFPLVGKHATLACQTCHANGVDAPLGRECASCHADDPHRGQLGPRCDSCHGQSAWPSQIRFDHGLIAFPLLGKHAALECKACHASAAFHDAGAECADCHGALDPHAGRFGAECATCHNPTAWSAWTFDHAKQTAFALTGTHAKVQCAACHRRPTAELAAAAAGGNCAACHRQDDPHAGRFGTTCATCHNTSSFGELRGR
ncbi:MAG TPA: cytochrome c3 family protein [Gammaproteobacteria bacterium]|nr:cytochrome c3 family protein [Gammaproteobacteria bacterium]